jgi:hypothetical protein
MRKMSVKHITVGDAHATNENTAGPSYHALLARISRDA